MPVCWTVCMWEQCICVRFQSWKNEKASPVTLATSVIHVSYMTWLQTQTHKCADTHPRVTKSLATALSACQRLDSPRSLDGLRDAVAMSHDPHRQPWDKKLIISPCGPRWMAEGHTVMRRMGWRRGNGPEALLWRWRNICHGGHSARQCVMHTHTKIHTHAHSRESYSDGQFCHQRLPSCHCDMERLGPYERLCSPKRCLGAGVREIRQSLLTRGHNQMWKLSCTLTGSIVAKSASRCNIDAVFQQVALRWWGGGGNWKHISNTWWLWISGSRILNLSHSNRAAQNVNHSAGLASQWANDGGKETKS